MAAAERDDGARLAALGQPREALAADIAALDRDVSGKAAADADAFRARMAGDLRALDAARAAAAEAAAAGIARLGAAVEAAQRTLGAQQACTRTGTRPLAFPEGGEE